MLVGLRQPRNSWLIGSNSDDPWKTRTRLITAKNGSYRYIGTELVCSGAQSVPWANMITRGLNEKGFAFTYAHVEPTDGNWTSMKGIDFHDFSTFLLSECASVREVENHIKKEKRSFHGNFLVNDSTQDIALLEVTTKRFNIIRPEDWEWPLPIISSNYYVSKKMRFFTDLGYAVETNSPSRWHNAMLTAINSNQEGMALMQEILSSHEGRIQMDGAWGRCPCNHGTEVGTVSSEIIDTARGLFYYCLGWPCECHDALPSQDYQHLSWGKFKPYKLADYTKPEVLVDCQRGINADF